MTGRPICPDKPPVVCFAGDDYWASNPHSRYHFMHALHRRGHCILWVNTIGMNMPKLGKKGFWRRVTGRLRSWSRWLRQVDDGFHVLAPIALPLFGNKILETLNGSWITFQVRVAYRLLGISEPLVFASIPSFADTVLSLPNSSLIYYYSDKYDSHRHVTAREAIRRRDKLLFEAADSVFCVSREIHESLRNRRPHVEYLPHAVDFDHFNGALKRVTVEPDEFATIRRPRVGYFGSLGDGVDREMIHHAASRAPDLQFVFIGKVLADYSELESLPNTHFLGYRNYEDLPRYARWFDLAFMAFRQNEWTYNCSPLKTKEYLSMGLPVVSCPIREIELTLADVVATAKDGPGFLSAIRHQLAEDGPELRRTRIEKVRDDSWDARTEQMLRHHSGAIPPEKAAKLGLGG
ncbi:MAG: glycosyltransferase family 1 protein [bacterium]|nr:glycosyltransferase family 1 protein [bacterium]